MRRPGIVDWLRQSRIGWSWFNDPATDTRDGLVIVRRLVDADWYRATYADVVEAGVDPVAHYFRHGRYEGRKPNRYFEPAFYAAEAAVHGIPITGDALAHYVGLGEPANVSPAAFFDPAWYRSAYGIEHGSNCLDHFLGHRASGLVSPNPHFDACHYLAEYPDVMATGSDPHEHWLDQGSAEGRLPRAERQLILRSGLFDENHYLVGAGDVFGANLDGLDHFVGVGWREGRSPNPYFDTDWYVDRHPDRLYANPLTDYILRGEAAGNSPSPIFDTAWYRRTYDVPSGSSPLRHWLEHRRTRMFSPLSNFDSAAYVAQAGGRVRPHHDPFLHALAAQVVLRQRGQGVS